LHVGIGIIMPLSPHKRAGDYRIALDAIVSQLPEKSVTLRKE
jgi:hypothetical protein